MAKSKMVLPLLLVLFVTACKKEGNKQGGVITFSLNGAAKTVTVPFDTLTTTISSGVQQKQMNFLTTTLSANTINYPVVGLSIVQFAPVGTAGMNVGAYQDETIDTLCWKPGTHLGCNGFGFTYIDLTLGDLEPSEMDSTSILNITAFSTNPNLISGNFKYQLTDGYGSNYQVTNGHFSNIAFVTQ